MKKTNYWNLKIIDIPIINYFFNEEIRLIVFFTNDNRGEAQSIVENDSSIKTGIQMIRFKY